MVISEYTSFLYRFQIYGIRILVICEVAAPEEVYFIRRSAKVTPYGVCFGCNGSVQTHEVDRNTVSETWHTECYEAEYGDGGEGNDDDEELFTAAFVEDN